jgi:quercetin dioxygenase-like cupin family protein
MALQVPITAFFEEPGKEPEIIVSRAGERPYTGNIRVMLESLGSGLEGQTLEPFVVTLKPGAGSGGPPMVHGGHELVYCLAGEVEYEVAGQTCRLGEGDSVLFEAQLEHRWRNAGTDPTKFLLVFQSAFEGESVEEHLAA